MDSAIEMLEKGQVGVVTLLGMGGVFLALLFLYAFTSFLGHHRKRKSTGPKEIPGTGTHPGRENSSPQPSQKSTGDELAAAIAVAIALDRKSSRKIPVPAPRSASRQESTWRAAGRLALMKPLSQHLRPGRD